MFCVVLTKAKSDVVSSDLFVYIIYYLRQLVSANVYSEDYQGISYEVTRSDGKARNIGHYDVIKWKHFRVTVPLCGESTGHWSDGKARNIGHYDVTKWKHFRVAVLCAGNPPVTGGFPSQRDSNADLWYFFVVSRSKLLKVPCSNLAIKMAKQNSQVIWKLPNTIFTHPFHIKSSNEAYFSKYVLNCIDAHPPVYQPHTADVFKPAVGDPKQWRHDRAVRMPMMGNSATCFPANSLRV